METQNFKLRICSVVGMLISLVYCIDAHEVKLPVNKVIYRNSQLIHISTDSDSNIEDKVISGRVTSNDGESLPGVNIIVEGTNIGTVTDMNGYFTINVPESGESLVVSFIGYITERIKIEGITELNIKLIPDIYTLSEIVVVGYGEISRSDLTGSVSSISTKDYKYQPITRIDQVLQGRSAGVQVTNNSGAPGADVRIRIRGANSIRGDNNPLIVVDGISGIEYRDINTNDIESVEILKDASSTAIYGSRGANGVILITTKKGKKDENLSINFGTFHSINQLPKKIDYLNAYDFASLYNIYRDEFGLAPYFTDEQLENFRTNGGTDWQDEVFRQGNTHTYNLSLQGGSAKSSYYISGEYIDQTGILINSDYKRYSLHSKIESELNKKIKVGINLSGNRRLAHNNSDIGSQWSTIGRLPQWVATEPIWENEGTLYNNLPLLGASAGNPVGIQKLNNNDGITNIFYSKGFAEIIVLPDLQIKASIGVELRNETYNSFYDRSFMEGETNPSASIYNTQRVRTEGNIVCNYSKTLGIHKIIVTGIYEESSLKQEESGAYANNVTSTMYGYHNLGINDGKNASSSYYDEYLRSFAGRVNYNIAGKYLLTGTIRADGSSKFKGDNKYGYFPSAALGWNLSEENFIKNLNVFDKLKLRASWGISGSQAIGSYATLTQFVQNNNTDYAIGGPGTSSPGTAVDQPGNTDLKWESTNQKDIGLEMSFFDGRLNFAGDYYYKLTSDLLLPYELPSYAGNFTIIKNVGEIENKGFEFMISGTPVSNSNFSWQIGFNLSANKNKVIDLGEENRFFTPTVYQDAGFPFVIEVGQPLGTFYGAKYLGVWKTTDIIPDGFNPGDARVDTFQIIGYAQPDFIFGINNTFTLLKNFDINIFFQGVKGGKIYNMQRQNSFGFTSQNQDFTSPEWYDRWTPENENTDIPAFTSSDDKSIFSSRWLEDASYIRLKNISIGFNFPERILEHIKISSLQVFISAQNLLTFTKYKGYDPEASTARHASNGLGSSTDTDQNIDSGAYPNPRTFTTGLRVSF